MPAFALNDDILLVVLRVFEHVAASACSVSMQAMGHSRQLVITLISILRRAFQSRLALCGMPSKTCV